MISSKNDKKRFKGMDVSKIREAGLCMGCGICEAVCPIPGSIKVIQHEKRGEYLPIIDYNFCTKCGHCLSVCPGEYVDFQNLENKFLDCAYKEKKLGTFQNCYIGHAVSRDIRYRSTSGGAVTTLLIYALERNIIDGALVLGMSDENPLETKPYIARTPSEVRSSIGSKYCPSASLTSLPDIMNKPGRYAIVGLPCHIHAIRKLEILNPRLHAKLKEKIVLILGLFCANNNTYLGTQYFLRTHRIDPDDVKHIQYRGDGWPGEIKVTQGSNNEITAIPRGTTEKKWYRQVLFSSAFHYHFTIPRCLLCPDLTSELADISFGDPWIDYYKKTEHIGKSLIIVRNKVGKEILDDILNAGYLELEEMPVKQVLEAQNYTFKLGVGARIRLRQVFGRATPVYRNRNLTYSREDFFNAFLYLPSYISYHQWLWSILRAFAIFVFLSQKVLRKIKSIFKLIIQKITPDNIA